MHWVDQQEHTVLAGSGPREEIVVEEVRGHQGREEPEGLLGHIKEPALLFTQNQSRDHLSKRRRGWTCSKRLTLSVGLKTD